MVLSQSVTKDIERDLNGWIDKFLEKQQSKALTRDLNKDVSDGKIKPFHEALLPNAFLKMSSFERSFSTLLGKSYERHSEIIAKPRFSRVKLQHKTEGELFESVDTEISDEIGRINKSHKSDDYHILIDKIVGMEKRGNGKKVTRSVTTDLYLQSEDGNEVFFEIKSPKPNKEQCLNITRKHLWIHAILKNTYPAVKTYFGMGYNPYGEGNEYKHSFAVNHLDIQRQTLIGKQYWDFLGGPGTFDELVKIYQRVGSAKHRAINKILDI